MIHQNASRYTVGFLRIWVFGIWFFIIFLDPFNELGLLLDSTFNPPGVLKFVPSQAWVWILTPAFLLGLKIFMLLCLAVVIVGISFAHPVALLTSVLLVFHQGLVRGFGGHINHAELMLLFAAIILAVFPSFDAFALRRPEPADKPPQVYSAPVLMILVIFTLTYHFAGVYRLIHGGVEVFTSSTMKYYMIRSAFSELYYSWDWGRLFLVYDHPIVNLLLNVNFAIITISEVLAPLSLVSRRFRYVWLAVTISLHVFTLFFFNVFWVSMLLLILFFDIDRWLIPQIPKGRHPVVFFDGVCALCNRFVTGVMSEDREGIFRFAPLQGETARTWLPEQPHHPAEWSIVLVDEEGRHYQSDASLRIISRLGGFYRGAALFLWIPKLIRDQIYRIVASNRYGVFGKLDPCRVPTVDERNRFLP